MPINQQDREKLIELLANVDAARKACPIQTKFSDECPKCHANPTQACGLIASAEYALVEGVRATIQERNDG